MTAAEKAKRAVRKVPTPLDPKAAIGFGLILVALLVWELHGVFSSTPGDTLTEAWTWTSWHLPAALSLVFLIGTVGALGWMILHFARRSPET